MLKQQTTRCVFFINSQLIGLKVLIVCGCSGELQYEIAIEGKGKKKKKEIK
jgi:hypothetical protein